MCADRCSRGDLRVGQPTGDRLGDLLLAGGQAVGLDDDRRDLGRLGRLDDQRDGPGSPSGCADRRRVRQPAPGGERSRAEAGPRSRPAATACARARTAVTMASCGGGSSRPSRARPTRRTSPRPARRTRQRPAASKSAVPGPSMSATPPGGAVSARARNPPATLAMRATRSTSRRRRAPGRVRGTGRARPRCRRRAGTPRVARPRSPAVRGTPGIGRCGRDGRRWRRAATRARWTAGEVAENSKSSTRNSRSQ